MNQTILCPKCKNTLECPWPDNSAAYSGAEKSQCHNALRLLRNIATLYLHLRRHATPLSTALKRSSGLRTLYPWKGHLRLPLEQLVLRSLALLDAESAVFQTVVWRRE